VYSIHTVVQLNDYSFYLPEPLDKYELQRPAGICLLALKSNLDTGRVSLMHLL